ncbi:MAG TPA: hypothetical protein VMM18_07495 [Gemmatimonadaceae bacterium]|nr:hypothetical protein [Gemmatimonadaceae bacterium]
MSDARLVAHAQQEAGSVDSGSGGGYAPDRHTVPLTAREWLMLALWMLVLAAAGVWLALRENRRQLPVSNLAAVVACRSRDASVVYDDGGHPPVAASAPRAAHAPPRTCR